MEHAKQSMTGPNLFSSKTSLKKKKELEKSLWGIPMELEIFCLEILYVFLIFNFFFFEFLRVYLTQTDNID